MNLWEMSLSGAVMITAVVIVRAFLLHRLPKKTFLILWGMVMLRLVVPFTIPSVFSVYSLLPESRLVRQVLTEDRRFDRFVENGSKELSVNTQAVEGKENSIETLSVKEVIWLGGLAVCAGYFFLAYRRLYREFAMSFPVKESFTEEWLAVHKGRRNIEIRQTDRIMAPVSYGVLHPVILFPKNTDWRDETLLSFVLEHEYVHIKRYDSFTKLFVTGIVCMHWFNPIVWLMYVLFNQDLELACDEAVLHRFGSASKSDYAHTLLCMEERKSGFVPLCNHFSRNAMEERIVAIMKTKKTTKLMTAVSALLIIGITGTFASSASKETFLVEDVLQGTDSRQTEQADIKAWKKEYEPFGITEKNGDFYYKNELVRYFLDGYEKEEEAGLSVLARYQAYNEEGTIDVHTVRQDTQEADGSTILFGKIIDIVPYTQEEFDARDISTLKAFREETATGTEEGNVDAAAREIEQYFEAFKAFGITYEKVDGSQGNIYWNGELVGEFLDQKPDGSVTLTVSVLKSEINVHTIYDDNGSLVGIAYLSEDENGKNLQNEAENSSGDIETAVEEAELLSYSDENGKIYYSADGGKTFMGEKEFNKTYAVPEIEWWTYEEYKKWLDNEKKELSNMLGEKAWTGGRGEFVWTQEIIDETIAQYEEIGKQIKNGYKYSKTVDGKSDAVLIGMYDKEQTTTAE